MHSSVWSSRHIPVLEKINVCQLHLRKGQCFNTFSLRTSFYRSTNYLIKITVTWNFKLRHHLLKTQSVLSVETRVNDLWSFSYYFDPKHACRKHQKITKMQRINLKCQLLGTNNAIQSTECRSKAPICNGYSTKHQQQCIPQNSNKQCCPEITDLQCRSQKANVQCYPDSTIKQCRAQNTNMQCNSHGNNKKCRSRTQIMQSHILSELLRLYI